MYAPPSPSLRVMRQPYFDHWVSTVLGSGPGIPHDAQRLASAIVRFSAHLVLSRV